MNEQPTGKDYVGSEELYADVQRCMKLVAEMNTGYHTETEVREYLRQITGSEIDETVRVFPPFNINYGKRTTFGKGSFVNFGCTFLALGGITIEEGAFIAPQCVLATEYHPEDPATRHSLLTKPIVIGRNAWIGACRRPATNVERTPPSSLVGVLQWRTTRGELATFEHR